MCDRAIVEIGNGIDDILKKVHSLFGVEHSNLILKVKKSSTVDVLHRKIKTIFLLYQPIKLDNSWVIERMVQFHLIDELIHHLHLDQFLLAYLLHRHEET